MKKVNLASNSTNIHHIENRYRVDLSSVWSFDNNDSCTSCEFSISSVYVLEYELVFGVVVGKLKLNLRVWATSIDLCDISKIICIKNAVQF